MGSMTEVRYVSPFGSPAWMERELAELLLDGDERTWGALTQIERETGENVLSEAQRQIGAPRIEVDA